MKAERLHAVQRRGPCFLHRVCLCVSQTNQIQQRLKEGTSGERETSTDPEVARDGGDCSVTLEEIFFSLSGIVELGRGEHPIAKVVYTGGGREQGLPSDVDPFPPPVPHEAWRPPAIQH